MSDSFDDLLGELGVDYSDDRDRLARDLVAADHQLLEDLIKARVLAGLSKSEVADAMGRHRSVVTNFEKLTSDPHLSTIRRYAAAVGALVRHQVEPTRPHTYRVIRRVDAALETARQVVGPQEFALDAVRRRVELSQHSASFDLWWGQFTRPDPAHDAVANDDGSIGLTCLK